MAPHRTPTDAETALAALYAATDAAQDRAAGGLRAAAFEHFRDRGLSGRRDETWKYTDLRGLLQDVKPLAGAPDAAARKLATEAGIVALPSARRLLFSGGTFLRDLSDVRTLESGLSVQSLAEALSDADPLITRHLGKVCDVDDPIFALNTALMGDGIIIHVGADRDISRPLHVVHHAGIASNSAFQRSLIVLEAGARMILIESFEGPTDLDYQVNTATEVVLGDGAVLTRCRLIRESSLAFHVGTLVSKLGEGARHHEVTLALGGRLVRNQSFVRLDGSDAEMSTRAAYLLSGRDQGDESLFLDHAHNGTRSRALYKSVVEDRAVAVFQGKILVRQSAQQTDARMMARALLLSDEAGAHCKPELEIYADDVQCAHGSTVGALDPDMIFYLMARGIPHEAAKSLLMEAFIAEIFDEMPEPALAEALARIVRARLTADNV